IVIGDLESRDYSTATEKAEEHFLSLHIWSDANGR
ncbi:tail completion protein gp17, partial [Rhizobium sp. BR5]